MLRTTSNLALPQTPAEIVDPSRAALLIYDMQVGITRQVKDAARIVNAITALIGKARDRGLRIAYSRHLSPPRAWLGATAARTAMSWQRLQDPANVALPFGREAEATQIVPELTPAADDLVFDKFAMSAFEGTHLATMMRDCELSTLIICGIATEVGIDPTLRQAADLGFIPVMVTDACGAGNLEAGERVVAALSFAGDTVMVTTEQLVAALG
jgi:nicotinamidase-related amidase